eukprot:TRINITY_DN37326_c0_g1_i1.p1 TRINITY_DN37326_c0_g1~~TRINITY_DN37326_c0_g1_i1.p1  ORF type:complete len:203 (+),score=38.07 TRINITY_DN37326_c0_g1_i1:31-609(+)
MVACVALLLLGRELLSTSSPPSPATGTTDANPELVFIALGDWGMPRHHQEEVAEALTRVARKVRPEFIVSLGDNFYPVGVRSTEDMQWRERFEEIYAKPPLIVPWHITLGDHDHQGSIDAQLLYSNISKRWKLPSSSIQTSASAGSCPAHTTPSKRAGRGPGGRACTSLWWTLWGSKVPTCRMGISAGLRKI